ncbi:class I SAM-dependent DNA methyltransferase [Amycolatopsis sp. cmx-11-12]|uniref:class I SAM-dependent DNA methyltransferase n=1 Tax=Amycolatopsis sp. cmx-11-12 TaxID=2785795 RepID=UPI0039182AFC
MQENKIYEEEYVEVYDFIHGGRGKNYVAEAKTALDLIRSRKPDVSSLLDVACGTGSHLLHFREELDDVEGLEISGRMLALAETKLPGVRLYQSDMREFDLGRKFDVVTCLFSSIAHLPTVDDLNSALRSFARHLNPGGVVLVEPFWSADSFIPGFVTADSVAVDGRAASRLSHSTRDGDAAVIEVQCLVAESESGIRHLTETTRVTLFTGEQYEDSFVQAGCTVERLPGGLSGRGVLVGVLKDSVHG